MKFIYTKDIDIKNKLVAKGFRLLQTFDNKIFVFENNCSSTFTKDELTKIVYSNTFCMRGGEQNEETKFAYKLLHR